MGRLIKKTRPGYFRGTNSTPALVLTAAAVLIPCAVWYALGSRHLDRVVVELQTGARREAATTAMQLSTKLALQLEDLRRAESDRTHLDYFPRYLWRGQRCGTLKVKTSALATGELPYAVLFYFQVDDEGVVTTPLGDAELAGLEVPARLRIGTRESHERPAGDRPARELGKWGGATVPSAVTTWPAREVGGRTHGPGRVPQSIEPQPPQSAPPPPGISPLVPGFAGELADPSLPATDDAHDVGEFRWYTGKWRGEPTLMAIRKLRLRDHDYQQGFAIESRSLSDWMFDGGFPATLLPGQPTSKTASVLPIGGATWHVAVDPEPSMASVRKQEATLRSQFRTSYFGGLLSALLAGACVVALVWRSGKLARERSRFAAAAAHELRTPLAGIRLHGEMLAGSLGNPSSIERYAQRITDEADRLGRVVANVLSYTRDDQRRLAIAAVPGDLAATVTHCLATIEPLLIESGARMEVAIEDHLPEVTFDADAIHQILRNLIDNAEKYTRSRADRRIEVTLGLGSDDDSVALTVSDHGPGIAPALRPQLFRPFGNAGNETNTAGLGLGLSVVHGFVIAHGGTVEYTDTPGGGATFTVTLPRVPAA